MLTLLERPEIIDIYNKYMKKDFPSNELKPISSILNMLERGIYNCYALFDGEKLLAYAYLTLLDDFVLVDYLAVVPMYRGKGVGTRLLSQLKGMLKGKTIIIECENPDFAKDKKTKAEQTRRIEFYKKSGFSLSGVTTLLFGVEYVILTYPECKNTAEGLKKLYLEMIGKPLMDKNLTIKVKS